MRFETIAVGMVVGAALLGGCRREEQAVVTTPPPAPPAAQQPAEAPPPTAGTTSGTDTTAQPGRTVGQTLDDATITTRVKAALLAADDVKGLQIDVDTTSGTVRLTGAVQNQTQSQRAEQIARNAEGVQRVENQLTVKPAS